MTRPGLVWTIAFREFREQTRSRVFRLSTLMTILIVIAAVVFPAIADRHRAQPVHPVGIVGPADSTLLEALTDAGAQSGTSVTVSEFSSLSDAESALRDGRIEIAVVPGQEMLVNQAPLAGVQNATTQLAAALSYNAQLYDYLVSSGLNPVAANQATALNPLPLRGLEPAPNRNVNDAQASSSGMILLFVFLTLYGAFVLNSVIEEKSSRVVEILLATVRPFDLLTGKVLGIGMVGSVQGGALVVATLVARSFTPGTTSASLTPAVLGFTLLWFALGFLLFAGLYACAGALVSRAADAQSLVMPLQIPLVASYAVGLFSSVNGPNSLVTVMSMIPFTAPMTMLERMSAREVPVWQVLLSISLTLGTAVIVMRVAVTIFSGGILRNGQRVRIREAVRNPVG